MGGRWTGERQVASSLNFSEGKPAKEVNCFPILKMDPRFVCLTSAPLMQASGDAGSGFPRTESFHPVVTIGQGYASVGWDGETIAGGRMDGHEELQTAG